LPYMNLRPFRVDADGIHMYAWAPNGRTTYFSDLGVGETVLAVNTSGRARPVTVGRIKAEVRPLRLIECRAQDRTLNVLLQADWHVRVSDVASEVRNSTAKTLMWVVTALTGRSAADAALSGAVVSRDGHSGFSASAAAAALATVLSLFQHGPDSHD